MRGALYESGFLAVVYPGKTDTISTERIYSIGTEVDSDGSTFIEEYPAMCSAETSATAPIRIQYNRLHRNSTDDGQQAFYEFFGSAGDTISVRTNQPLQLFAPDNTLITETASEEGISALQLLQDGLYRIIVSGDGSHMLMVEADAEFTDLVYNTPISGSLATVDRTTHSFFGRAGDVVTVAASSRDFDIRLRLAMEDGDVLAEDDDGGNTFLDAEITAFSLPTTGVYMVEINSWNDKTGSYTLEVTQ